MTLTRWFTHRPFYDAICNLPGAAEWQAVVEVGVWKGESLIHLARRLPDCPYVVAVDLWEATRDEAILRLAPDDVPEIYKTYYQATINAGVRDRIIDVLEDSAEAAAFFADDQFDFCFIDASHDYDSVYRDVMAWFPKVRSGGLLAGHDYSDPRVKAAVRDALCDLLPQLDATTAKYPQGDVWALEVP